MNLLAQINGRTYAATTIRHPSDFASPFSEGLFPCLVWDHQGRFDKAQQRDVAKALLDAGCRYAVCGGKECEAWHDSFDWEFVERHLNDADEVREAEHIMTTWHEGETPDEVAFFFVCNTNFDDHDFTRYLVLHIGADETNDDVDAAIRRHAG